MLYTGCLHCVFTSALVTDYSNIPATLILDLRDRDDGPKEYEGVECIDISPFKEYKDGLDESSIMVSMNKSLSEGASKILRFHFSLYFFLQRRNVK